MVPLGRAGLRPSAEVRDDFAITELMQVVRDEMLPLDRNYFRRAAGLTTSLDRLDAGWRTISSHMRVGGTEAVKAREAAAMVATSRWAYRSALARAESRGMHRRSDRPASDPAFDCLFEAGGLESVMVERRAIPWTTAA